MSGQTRSLEEEQAAARKAVIEAFDGDAELAESWLNQPIKAIGNEKPIDLMNSLERIRILRGLIKKLEQRL
ncbi:hypothetical protein ACP86_08775 [Marinobacter sp. CP1]|jgi:uncharacterized protein (DUF2384 family)|uniref:antitoxin Xre/MbcA/ParS toxin-binding domain-containing protein n=1 Tax=unclassified Marinobacter TaxID=83889 RepID=UPI00069D9BA8|nr:MULTISPECIES: antitoxin Xre/MbcA/ParS toxin-binding domain-containing protein [unclassified Marinobacter]AKV96242.1 hypothetical protein ACP86_08775 [Marinobacter sp. CP1]